MAPRIARIRVCFVLVWVVLLSAVVQGAEVWGQGHQLRAKQARISAEDGPAASTRIIGGKTADDTMPWVVLFHMSGGNDITCTGSVIAPRWIVTAAHCILNSRSDGYVTEQGTEVTYGCSNVNSEQCKIARAVTVKGHPCYTPSTDQDHDDLALIELDRDLDITPVLVDGWEWGVVPIKKDDPVSLAGFGTVANSPVVASPDLMRVTLPLSTEQACILANPWRYDKGYVDFSNTWCTGGTEGKDSCYGDSGGPAVYQHRGVDFLIGILSIGSEKPAGSACGMEGRYGVYTKLRHYSAWMRAVIEGGDGDAIEACPAVAIHNSTQVTDVSGARPSEMVIEDDSESGQGADRKSVV